MSDEKPSSDVLAFPGVPPVGETARVDATATPEEPRPEPTMGRCMKCATVMKLEDTFRREENTPRVHRVGTTRHNVIGSAICGPVMTTLLFMIWAKRQELGQPERTVRGVLPAGRPPEENQGVIDRWESALAEVDKANDGCVGTDGGPVATYVVERWQLVGAEG